MTKAVPSRSLAEWLDYIEALHPSEIEMGLERIKHVYSRLPQLPKNIPVVTIAGTNGKGSTVRSVEAIALAKGMRVGAYTSPHLVCYNERIQINQTPVSDESLVLAFERVDNARQGTQLTYFEYGTLAALVLLAESNLELIVLEIGLGGRLDAVNIIDPAVAIITSISIDHESWLGDNREDIGSEKAGIIRSDAVFVCGDDNPPKTVLDASKAARQSYIRGQDFDLIHKKNYGIEVNWTVNGTKANGVLPPSPLMPENILNAVQAMAVLGFQIDSVLLTKMVPFLGLTGRQQIVQDRPFVMLDVGHNQQAAHGLAQRIGKEKLDRKLGRCYCLIGMLSDKNHSNTLAELLPVVDEWLVAEINAGSRSMPAADLSRMLLEAGGYLGGQYRSPVAAYRYALSALHPSDMLIVFGSFYTVADILSKA